MIVYIEYVIIDNVIIDYLILKATFALTGYPTAKKWLLFSAFFGAAVALTYPLTQSLPLLSVPVKILSGLTMLLIAGKYKTIKSFYITALIFFLFTFLTGGAITGIYNLLGLPYSTEISVALITLPVYLIIKGLLNVIKFIYKRKDSVALTYKIKLCMFDKEVDCLGFMDTGNSLFDGDRPVIVCHKGVAKKLIGDNIIKIKFIKLNVSTINGEKQKIAFRLDKLTLYNGDEPNIYNNVTVCINESAFGENCDVILHPALLKEIKNENDCVA